MTIRPTIAPTSGFRYCPYVVSTTPGLGNFTTIQDAVNAAMAGPFGLDNTFPVIVLREGSYGGTVTIDTGATAWLITITSIVPGNINSEANVNCDVCWVITGTHGSQINFRGFSQTVAGAAADIFSIQAAGYTINISDCSFFHMAGGKSLVNDNGNTNNITFNNCHGKTQGNTSLFNLTGGSNLNINNSVFANGTLGAGVDNSLPSTFANCNVTFTDSEFDSYFTASGTSNISMFNCRIRTNGDAAPPVARPQFVLSDTSTLFAENCLFDANFPVVSTTQQVGTLAAGTSAVLKVCILNSDSPSGAISGAGSLSYGECIFTGAGNFTAVSTETYFPLDVKQGGTGASTLTDHGVLLGAGTGPVTATAVGSTGQVLQGNTGASPTYSTATYPSTAGTLGNVLTSDGTNFVSSPPAASGFTSINIQTFTGSGTYTPTAGMKYCIIEAVGGGGGGGGTASATTNAVAFGAAGGGGGYSRKFASAATIGVSQTVTIGGAGTGGTAGNNPGGNGGDTSVGVICIGKGATGGSGNTGGGNSFGGAGGIAGTGDFSIPGQAGMSGSVLTANGTTDFRQIAGSSVMGFGAVCVSATTPATGPAGQNYGGGGLGGVSFNGNGAAAGGAGAAGIVVITEFI